MAELTPGGRKWWFTGQAVALVLVWLVLALWGSRIAGHYGLVWDGSGMGLGEARALVAELPERTRVVVIGIAPVERVLVPLARESARLTITHMDAGLLAGFPEAREAGLRPGDIQVSWGESWMLLHEPDLRTVMNSLSLVTSPKRPMPGVPAPASYLPLTEEPVQTRSLSVARAEAVVWAVSGLLLPVALAGLGFTLRVWRRGR
ncbi:MAG: hypothetical protein OEW11_04070 [Nitrospirota bacterium]|nr:hypothetical protein [Nitrospirota bacterium]